MTRGIIIIPIWNLEIISLHSINPIDIEGGGGFHLIRGVLTNSKFLDFSIYHLFFPLVKSFVIFICNFYKKKWLSNFFLDAKNDSFSRKWYKIIFRTKKILFFCLKSVIWQFFEVHDFKSKTGDFENSTHTYVYTVAFMTRSNLKAAPEESMQLWELINGSNRSLGHYLLWRIGFLEVLTSHSSARTPRQLITT